LGFKIFTVTVQHPEIDAASFRLEENQLMSKKTNEELKARAVRLVQDNSAG